MYSRNMKIFCLFLLTSILLSTLQVSDVKGDNWLSGWTYRKYHVINPSAGAGTNYQVNVTIYYGNGVDTGARVYLNGKCRTDFGDVRFTKVDGTTLLDYWIESKFNSFNATFWIEIADDLSSVSKTIYLYYGNSGTTSTSNGANTFIFFDDFETNLDKWTLLGKTGLRFSGSNNLGSPLGFGTIGDFDGYSPFTLECWFKTTSTGTQPLIVRMNLPYQVPGGGNGRGYALFLYNGRVWVELRNSAYEPINEILIGGNVRTVNDGNWHHVIATYDGSQSASGIHIYLDKVEETFDVQSDTLNGTISCPARFNIATYGGFYYFKGDVDEVVVYTSELTSSDAVARYNNGEGTETILGGDVYAHWTMDEGSGTDVIDVSGHPERNLWLATAGGPVPSWVTGVVEAPAISTVHSFSGSKSIKVPVGDLASHLQSPYGDKAVHIRFYDELSPLKESAVVSIDAGEAEVSYIGLINDIDQYEYRLQSVDYNTGINRTAGWHKFITRSTTNLKQFIIDGNLMSVTGTGNYCPVTFLITSATAEAPSYWDTIFITKFVSPEPTHGMWSGEDNGSILTTTILSTESDNPSSITVWTVILVIVDPLTTVTQTSITASVTSQTTTTSCTTSKETTKTTTTASTSTSCTTSMETSKTTSTASTTSTCTTSKETSRTTTTTCTSTTSKSSTVETTTTTPTTSVFTSRTTSTTPTTTSVTGITCTTASTSTTPTTSVFTSRTTTSTPTCTTSILTTKTTTTSFSSTSTILTNKITTETSFSSTSTSTTKTTTTESSTTSTTTTPKSIITSIVSTTTSTTTTPKSIITTITSTTTPTTTTIKSITTTTEVTVIYTFTRSMATVTYTSSTTSIRTDVVGLIYGVFTATGTSIISFTAPVYTPSLTAWTWTVQINPFTTYTASQSADIPVFVSFLVDQFTLTSATTTEIYDSYTYDAFVGSTIAIRSETINFGTTTTTCDTSVKSSTESTTFCETLTNSSTESTTVCETSIHSSTSSTTFCETPVNSSTSSTTTCDTSVYSSTESTTFCVSSTYSSTSSTTFCETSIYSSTSSTTFCVSSTYSSTSSTTFCVSSTYSSTSTIYETTTTTRTDVTSTETFCSTTTSVSTECEITTSDIVSTSTLYSTACITTIETKTFPYTKTKTYMITSSGSPLETYTVTTTMVIVSDLVTLYTTSTYTDFVTTVTTDLTTTSSVVVSTLTTSVSTSIGILGQGWNILMIPIILFAGIIVVAAVLRRRR